MRTIILASIAIALVLPPYKSARSQDTEDKSADPIMREYRSKIPLLIERYSTNRKIRTRDIRYATKTTNGLNVGDERGNILGEVITDGQQIKALVLEGKLADPVLDKRKSDVNFWRPDMRFDVTKKGGQFKIANQDLARTNYYLHEVMKYHWNAHVPMSAGGCMGTTLWFDERQRNYAIVTVVDVKPATWKGRSCIEVRSRWDNRHGMIQLASTYLDPANDYITIGTETDWQKDNSNLRSDPATRKELKLIEEIEYAPSAEGFLLPKFYRLTRQFRDGSVQKLKNIEFLSYERYVPAPEEFQLEKPFGLVTPAVAELQPNPALAPHKPRRVWPWVAIAAGVVLATVVLVIVRRSRRQESPAAP